MSARYGGRTGEVVVALTQRPDGMRLHEIADAIAAPLSSVQRAVATLSGSRLVEIGTERPPRSSLNARHPAADGLVEFSLRAEPIERVMDITCRANPAVEFAGRDRAGYLVVLSPFAQPVDLVRLRSTAERINRSRADAVLVEIMERDDVRESLLESRDLRERGLRLTIVKGSAIRTFRDPHEHGSLGAPRLGRLHPSLPSVPRRMLKRLADEHRLARLAAFGSAVRSDFRPDSDVDVMVEALPGSPLRLRAVLDVQEQLEKLLGRDVDVVNVHALKDPVLRRAQEEAVVLYERARP
jgi:predicted nucleotidyltransferase